MLGDVEPGAIVLAVRRLKAGLVGGKRLPEIKVINRSLLVSHVDVEGEKVHRSESLSAQDLEEGG